MARNFDINANVRLTGPSNIRPIVRTIQKQLTGISANIGIQMNPNVTNQVRTLNQQLSSLNPTLQKTAQYATQAADGLSRISSSLQGNTRSLASWTKNMNNAATNTQNAAKNTQRLTTEMAEFGRVSGLAIRRFAGFSVATGVIFGLIGRIKDATGEAIEFNRQLVRVGQAVGVTTANLSSLSRTITELSTDLGVSSKSLIEVSLILAQAGLSAKDTRLALTALAKTELAPTFTNINNTVEGSIAIMAQFGIQAKDLEKVLGSVNLVSAKFAVESDDIIQAVRRAGGAFAAASAGVSEGTDALNEFIAVFTGVRATTRESAESVATGLRTIFTRLQRETTITQLEELGIQLRDLEGKFVGPYKAINNIAFALENLDTRDVRFARIVEELGGFRQVSKVIPLITATETRIKALQVAQEGQLSLDKDVAAAQEAYAVQIAKVREEFVALVREVSETDTFKGLLDLSLDLARAFIDVARALKPLIPLIGAFAAIKIGSSSLQFLSGFSRGVKGAGGPGGFGLGLANLLSPNRFNSGGLIPGRGPNRDSVFAHLTPGEYVIQRPAVDALGVDFLNSLNRNKGGIIHAQKGRLISADTNNRVFKNKSGKEIGTIANSLEALRGRKKGKFDSLRKFGLISLFPLGGVHEKVFGSVPFSDIASKLQIGKNDTTDIKALAPKGVSDIPFELDIRSIPKSQAVELQKVYSKGIINTIRDASSLLAKKFKVNKGSVKPADILKNINLEQISGNLFEGTLLRFDPPFGAEVRQSANAPFDFPGGVGGTLGQIFPGLDAVPSDAKRTVGSRTIKNVLGKVKQFVTNEINASVAGLKFQKRAKSGSSIEVDNTDLGNIFGTSSVKAAERAAGRTRLPGGKRLDFERGPDGNILAEKRGQRLFYRLLSRNTGGDVPAMLTKGEYVLQKSAVDALGTNAVEQLNQAHKNKFHSGGPVGFNTGGGLFSAKNISRTNADLFKLLTDPANKGLTPAGESIGRDRAELVSVGRDLENLGFSIREINKGLTAYTTALVDGKTKTEALTDAFAEATYTQDKRNSARASTAQLRAEDRKNRRSGLRSLFFGGAETAELRGLEQLQLGGTKLDETQQARFNVLAQRAQRRQVIRQGAATAAVFGVSQLNSIIADRAEATQSPALAGAGGALAGAVTGGALGASFGGPIGAGVGAIIGGVATGLQSAEDAAKRFAESNLDKAAEKFSESLQSLSGVKTQAEFNAVFANIGREIQNTIEKGRAVDAVAQNQTFGFGSNRLGAAVGLSAGAAINPLSSFLPRFSGVSNETLLRAQKQDSFAGFKALFPGTTKELENAAELDRDTELQRSQGQFKPIVDELKGRISEAVRGGFEIPPSQLDALRDIFERAGDDFNVFREELDKQNALEKKLRESARLANQEVDLFTERMANVAAIANKATELLQLRTQAEQRFFNTVSGNFTSGGVARPDVFGNFRASSESELLNRTRELRPLVGDELGNELESTVVAVKRLNEVLPDFFRSASLGDRIGEANLETELSKAISDVFGPDVSDAIPRIVANTLRTEFGGSRQDADGGFKEFLSGVNFDKLGEQASQAFSEALKALDATLQQSIDRHNSALDRVVNTTISINSQLEGALERRLGIELETTRLLGRSVAPAIRAQTDFRVNRLAGTTNVGDIRSTIISTQNALREEQLRRDASGPSLESDNAILRLVTTLENNKKALEILASETGELAAVQEEIKDAERKRELASKSLAELATGGFEERFEFLRRASAASALNAGVSLDGKILGDAISGLREIADLGEGVGAISSDRARELRRTADLGPLNSPFIRRFLGADRLPFVSDRLSGREVEGLAVDKLGAAADAQLEAARALIDVTTRLDAAEKALADSRVEVSATDVAKIFEASIDKFIRNEELTRLTRAEYDAVKEIRADVKKIADKPLPKPTPKPIAKPAIPPEKDAGHFAYGGLIPGVSMSPDDTLAKVTRGEYVVNKGAVGTGGNLAVLEAMNSGMLTFASGGIVGGVLDFFGSAYNNLFGKKEINPARIPGVGGTRNSAFTSEELGRKLNRREILFNRSLRRRRNSTAFRNAISTGKGIGNIGAVPSQDRITNLIKRREAERAEVLAARARQKERARLVSARREFLPSEDKAKLYTSSGRYLSRAERAIRARGPLAVSRPASTGTIAEKAAAARAAGFGSASRNSPFITRDLGGGQQLFIGASGNSVRNYRQTGNVPNPFGRGDSAVSRALDTNINGIPEAIRRGRLGRAGILSQRNQARFGALGQLIRSFSFNNNNFPGASGGLNRLSLGDYFKKLREAQSIGSGASVLPPGLRSGIQPAEIERNRFRRRPGVRTAYATGGSVGRASGGGSSVLASSMSEFVRVLPESAKMISGAAMTLSQAAEKLQSINIPTNIEMTATINHNINLNGAEVLSALKGELGNMVRSMIMSEIAKHINVQTGETRDGGIIFPNGTSVRAPWET